MTVLGHLLILAIGIWAAYDLGKQSGRVDGLREARRALREERARYAYYKGIGPPS